eukprot:TRINITY_DN26669_c0_g1_i1.p1 TRINITY_DN26669_c0_g1~~TRINITY_DN26669_c0_g1_i1.p1  ORF type:complete len:363 (+),score=99.64 TRINITY_DN26669_c0_g1_i1:59-1147(+)
MFDPDDPAHAVEEPDTVTIEPGLARAWVALQSCSVFFLNNCRKLSSKGRYLQRTVVITREQLYLCADKGEITRCVRLATIKEILIGEGADGVAFVVNVIGEHAMRLAFSDPRRADEAADVVQRLMKISGRTELLPVRRLPLGQDPGAGLNFTRAVNYRVHIDAETEEERMFTRSPRRTDTVPMTLRAGTIQSIAGTVDGRSVRFGHADLISPRTPTVELSAVTALAAAAAERSSAGEEDASQSSSLSEYPVVSKASLSPRAQDRVSAVLSTDGGEPQAVVKLTPQQVSALELAGPSGVDFNVSLGAVRQTKLRTSIPPVARRPKHTTRVPPLSRDTDAALPVGRRVSIGLQNRVRPAPVLCR